MSYRNGALFFDAEAYWRDKEYKKWVVQLTKGSGARAERRTYIIQARTCERAIIAAKNYSTLTGKLTGYARLAEPADLGCTEATCKA